jgi:glycosyltransferase involved in cell wall biosynthesis
MAELPRISIVVPNFNAAGTLAATLDSIIEQQYPGLELFVMDGASTDGSVEIIKRYEQHLTGWVSEKDSGQSDAINKGFARCTGQVVNWLCSDDMLMPGALLKVGHHFAADPELSVLIGAVDHRYTEATHKSWIDHPTDDLIPVIGVGIVFSQPSCFYKRSLLLDRPTPLDPTMHYAMDTELWAYFKSRNVKWKTIPDVLSIFQISGANKSSVAGAKMTRELETIYKRYHHELIPLTFWHRYLRHPLEKWRFVRPGYPDRLFRRPLEIAFTGIFGMFYGFDKVRAMNWGNWAGPQRRKSS